MNGKADLRNHHNNFDFLRLLFAILVILSHSIVLSGSTSTDLLYAITLNQFVWSDLGLSGFFIISGYLIFESLRRSETVFDYYKKRVLRIYPGFIVAVIFTVIVCSFVTEVSLKEYYKDPSPWQYLVSKITMFFESKLRIIGTFLKNPYPEVVNGSLWTIPYEFLYYVFLSFLFTWRSKRKTVLIIVGVAYIGAIVLYYGKDTLFPGWMYYYLMVPFRAYQFDPLFSFGFYFCGGVLLANIKSFILKYKVVLFFCSIGLCIVFVVLKSFVIAAHFILPFLIISFGLMKTKWINNISNRIGDLSYGVYLYAFLIQQVLMNYWHFKYWQLDLLTLPLSFLCAYFSWNYIESPFLKMKTRMKKPAVNIIKELEVN